MMRRLLAPVVAALALVGSAATAPVRPARAVGPATPVLLLHGWNPFESVGYSCPLYWGRMERALRSAGWDGPLVTLKYQALDTGCDATIDDDGSHDADRGNDDRLSRRYNHSLIDPNAHSSQTPIEHLAYHLAWFVYRHYTRRGVPVDLVGHSMGGLIIRSALTQFERNRPGFPPRLLVRRALTIATPHRGSPKARLCKPAFARECAEMIPGSAFLRSLADAPRATGGTAWFLMGSAHDELVPPWSSMGMAGAAFRALYQRPRYEHFTILLDTRRSFGATWMQSERDGAWRRRTDAPFSDRAVRRLLVAGRQM